MRGSVLAVLLIVCGLVFATLCVLVYINRDSENTVALFIKSIALPLVAAFTFVSLDLFRPEPSQKRNVLISVIHDYNLSIAPFWKKMVLSGSTHYAGNQIFDDVLSALRYDTEQHGKPRPASSDRLFLDLVEISFFRWVCQNYPGNWELSRDEFRGINMRGGMVAAAPGAESDPMVLTAEQIKDGLIGNSIAEAGLDPFVLGCMCLPHGSQVSFSRSPVRQLRVENDHLQLIISFSQIGSDGGGGSDFGGKLIRLYPGYSEFDYYRVSFDYRIKRLRKWSPMTNRQRKWVEDLIERFVRDFEWENIRAELSKD